MYKLKRYGYTPILGWSVSRYDKFLLCKRQYYYDYYGKFDKEHSRQKIDSLKKMTTRALEVGNIAHDIFKVLLERLLKSEGTINRKKFLDFVGKKTDEYCRSKIFAEVYYNETPSIGIDGIYEEVLLSLDNFLTSERCTWLMEKALSEKEHWLIEPPGFGETRINGMKAYCKVDFLFPLKGEIYIIDWKTGKPSPQKHRKQMIGYTSWAAGEFGHPPEKIHPILSYVKPVYEETTLEVNPEDIEEFRNQVEEETREMYQYLTDVEGNLPQSKENFPMVEEKKWCSYCNYRELCL